MSEERLSPEEYLLKLEAEMSRTEEQPKELPQTKITEEKAEEKPKKKKKKRKKKHYFLRFLIFCVVVVGAVYALRSSLFNVTEIKVVGNRFYTPAQVIEMSGLQTGKNIIFETKLKPARDLLLETPYIRIANIKRQLRGTIVIELEERLEYACVPYGDGYVLIDRDGMVLSISEKQPELPMLEGLLIEDITVGKPLKIEQAYLLTDTLNLLLEVDDTDLYFYKIYFSSVIVRAYINENYYCEGRPEEIRKGLSDIRTVISQQYEKGVSKGVIRVGSDGYISFSPKID